MDKDMIDAIVERMMGAVLWAVVLAFIAGSGVAFLVCWMFA